MCSAGARLSSHAARAAANNNLKSTSHEHREQRGTCHSGSGPAPAAAVHHSAWWNGNTAPPQPLPVSPWQPGDWWDDVIVNTRAHTHTHTHTHTHKHRVMDAFAMNHGLGHYHLFGRAPSPRIPIGLTRWPSPESAPSPRSPSPALCPSPLLHTTLEQSHAHTVCENTSSASTSSSLKYLPSAPNPEWPGCWMN